MAGSGSGAGVTPLAALRHHGVPAREGGNDATRPSASRAPGRVACGDGKRARGWQTERTDTAPPVGARKRGPTGGEAATVERVAARTGVQRTELITLRLAVTTRRWLHDLLMQVVRL